ncbi:DUF2330 domain-containing protein [Candidatus Shapirobacteria bacterium]|nr:DUF2330 domain-containing protein [Candidatus Shapirobacteria bacterium]
MKKISNLITLSLIIFLAVFSFIPKSVLADGMVVIPDPYSDRWDYSNESNQQAFINYDGDLQKMIISVGLEGEHSKEVVWLFPVPADPNKVAIDVLESLPRLSGEEISGKARSNLDDKTEWLQMTQLYTIPLVSAYETRKVASENVNKAFDAPQGINGMREPDVIVYEHLDKEGISSEIITAKTANGLYDYLKRKGLKIEIGSIPVLNNYISKDYSFVISWITPQTASVDRNEIETYLNNYLLNHYDNKLGRLIDTFFETHPQLKDQTSRFSAIDTNPALKEELITQIENTIQEDPLLLPRAPTKNQWGIFVTFPTRNIYYPLLPTSVYGSKTVPTTIRVIGHVSPKIFQDIKSYTKTEYYVDGHASFADDIKNFYDGQSKEIKYTKVEINAPSKFLTDDLWISNSTPIKTYYSTFFAKYPATSAILLLIISSLIAGVLVGWIIFKSLRKNMFKLGLVGLSNCLSILGLLITTVLISTKEKDEDIKPVLTEIEQKGYVWKRKLAAILLVADSPFLLISFPSLIEELVDSFGPGYFYATEQLTLVLVLVAVLIFSLIIKRVRPEDKNLFEQLKLNNYSSWSFQPKDRAKIIFVPLFSVSFLGISWLLVKLVGLTV